MEIMIDRKLVIIMVGLPARRKTFLSLRLQRYLEWQGVRVRIFNVGAYRREALGLGSSRSGFFNPRVKAFAKEREAIAKRCFADLAGWLKEGGEIVIYDATNVTSARRDYLKDECVRNGFDYLFVENICDNPEILGDIVDSKITTSADYREEDPVIAREDFRRRIEHYRSVYETVDRGSPYIKIFNFGEKVEKNFGPSALFEEIAEFLGNINLTEKNIFITRHGETLFNLEDRIGGDSVLTAKGADYARRLGDFFRGMDIAVFTSEKKRTMETALCIDGSKTALPELNEISSGVCDSMTYGEIASKYPDIDRGRGADKLNFRYPQGESYLDLIQRVKKAVVKIESRRKDVLVIAHRAVNRCLFSYFVPTPLEQVPYIEMPLDRVLRIYRRKALYGHESMEV